jgi:transketolase
MAFRAKVGHIGSALSIADIITALYFHVLRISSPTDPKRDRFILSKGHAALAVYVALYLRGWLSQNDLESYCQDGSLLGDHPEHHIAGIDFSTGSLGQGLSMGAGSALAALLQEQDRRVFVLMSDAECNEGSVWESAMFAAHHKLSNLTAIIDCNGQQAFGHTKDVLDLSPMAEKWRAFGWRVTEIDGHQADLLGTALEDHSGLGQAPHMIIANTVCGKGVPYMERMIKWHYWPMTEQEYREAVSAVEAMS